MSIHHFQTLVNWPEPEIENQLLALHRSIFGAEATAQDLHERFSAYRHGLVLLAWEEQTLIGYKIGYERKTHHYYSWLGGIHPDWRKQGIGAQLMVLQHQWCRDHHYHTIRTHTKNKWREMLILNLRHGFDIIGTLTDEQGEPKLILEKKLYPLALSLSGSKDNK